MTNGSTTKIVTSLLVATFIAASSGAFLVYRELGEVSSALSGLSDRVEDLRSDYGERLRYLERARRGLLPGDP